jgi:hypothetical protein
MATESDDDSYTPHFVVHGEINYYQSFEIGLIVTSVLTFLICIVIPAALWVHHKHQYAHYNTEYHLREQNGDLDKSDHDDKTDDKPSATVEGGQGEDNTSSEASSTRNLHQLESLSTTTLSSTTQEEGHQEQPDPEQPASATPGSTTEGENRNEESINSPSRNRSGSGRVRQSSSLSLRSFSLGSRRTQRQQQQTVHHYYFESWWSKQLHPNTAMKQLLMVWYFAAFLFLLGTGLLLSHLKVQSDQQFLISQHTQYDGPMDVQSLTIQQTEAVERFRWYFDRVFKAQVQLEVSFDCLEKECTNVLVEYEPCLAAFTCFQYETSTSSSGGRDKENPVFATQTNDDGTNARECNVTRKQEMVELAQQCIDENMVVMDDPSRGLSDTDGNITDASKKRSIVLYGNCQTCQAYSTILDPDDSNERRFLFNGIFFIAMGVCTLIFWFKISQLYQDKFVPEPPTGRRRLKLSSILCCVGRKKQQQQQGRDQNLQPEQQEEDSQPEWIRRLHHLWDENVGRRIQERRQRQHTPNDPTLNHIRRLEARRNHGTRVRQTSDLRSRIYHRHQGHSAAADATGIVHHQIHTDHNRHGNPNHHRTIDDELNEFTVQRIMVVALAQAEGNDDGTDNDSTIENDSNEQSSSAM